MGRFVVLRCLWMVPSLFGITLVAFLVQDLAPLDAAEIEAARLQQGRTLSAEELETELRNLEIQRGLVDRDTGERRSVWERYGGWLRNVVDLEFHGAADDPDEFGQRLGKALPVTLLINFWALVLALGVAAFVGVRAGLRPGRLFDRATAGAGFLLFGVPEIVLATLLLLGLAGAGWFPAYGLQTDGLEAATWWQRIGDLAWHLVLPVLALAVGPAVVLLRFVRNSVVEAARSDFALQLEAWGAEPAQLRRRVRRAGWSPVVTIAGTLLPMMVGGSLIVENVFSLPGMGKLAWEAVRERDEAMVMTLTLLSAIPTLIGLVVSDVLHALVDPRVRLS